MVSADGWPGLESVRSNVPWELRGTTVTMVFDRAARTLSFWRGETESRARPSAVWSDLPDCDMILCVSLYDNNAEVLAIRVAAPHIE
eukprot:COSAG01_NODE_8409_length_2794_cov_9.595176_2_plen_87_part_00